MDFDISRIKRMYDDSFEKGKDVARDIHREQEEKKEKAEAAEADPLVRIKELADLKEKGLLSDDEYEALKKKILS